MMERTRIDLSMETTSLAVGKQIEQTEAAGATRVNGAAVRVVLGRVVSSLVILVVIAYLATFGLEMAARGRAGLPAEPLQAALEAVRQTALYFVQHPDTYFLQRANQAAWLVVARAFINSAGLLLAALGLAALFGIPLGVFAALSRRKSAGALLSVVSIIGISIPSFFLGMLLWMLNIQMRNYLGVPALPQTGFGWDAHILMPALVLAARPFAQVARMTHVALADALAQDYVQTARAKGLRERVVVVRHAMRNALAPILNTLGASLRFSLASLPVVELFFAWPGVGLLLLTAIERGMDTLVVDIVVALGAFFLIVNLALEIVSLRLDPRLRETQGERDLRHEQGPSWRERLRALREWLTPHKRETKKSLPPLTSLGATGSAADPAPRFDLKAFRRTLRLVLNNPAFVVGTLLVVFLFSMALWGAQWTAANPYETHSTMTIEGKTSGPPFAPSSVFPWGSDPVGRDVQALVLWGARVTLGLAFLAVVARLVLGSILGVMAGWWRGSRLDKLVQGAISVMAAFPVTLFAAIMVLGLGIQQGVWVFVIALCVVGWGEIAQFLRGQVWSLVRMPFVESAHATGAGNGRILSRHVMPQLVGSLLVLAALEMGAVLMVLAELGFLNIFLGGGYRVEIGDTGRSAIVYYFSDVPEWGALLANIRNWWRSYGWLAWYPGILFFISILAFNLFGEGLRRYLEESRINVSRAFTRISLGVACVAVVGMFAFVQSSSPLERYRPVAQSFDATRAMLDIRALASPEFAGREAGMPGAQRAAEYIAQQMEEIGLQPAGEDETFLRVTPNPRVHLHKVPQLRVANSNGALEELTYRRDFVEYVTRGLTMGKILAPVVGLALGPEPEPGPTDPYKLRDLDVRNKIVIVPEETVGRFTPGLTGGVLVVTRDKGNLERRWLVPGIATMTARNLVRSVPMMYITPEVADRLLASAGSSLAGLEETASGLQTGQAQVTPDGTRVEMEVEGTRAEGLEEKNYDVIGFIPGAGSQQRTAEGGGMDRQVILVSAYYDGLGVGPDGTLYPGANDNASGVAALLELARVLKASPYAPNKTIVFVAWGGGERFDGLSVFNIMNTKTGFNRLRVESVLELNGVGGGSGEAVQLNSGTSFRLVQLFQSAAEKLNVPLTTRGRGPHFGIPTIFGFGGRSALTANVSWDGSDEYAHTPRDTVENLNPSQLEQLGELVALVLSVLSREAEY